MTIDSHICSGGIATIPDLRGDGACYSGDQPFDELIITQIPSPGVQVGAGQTIINVLTEDGNGNATVCTHYLNVTADNPAPTLECPDPIVTWLLTGGYEVPDLTKEVEIIGGCTVYDDLVITQSPVAGTKITTAGVHTITITVTDGYGHAVVCGSTTVTLNSPSTVPVVPAVPPPTPVTTPTYIYPVNLLAYWPFDDIGFLIDRGGYVLGSPGAGRDLTNAGAVIQEPSQTVLDGSCHSHSPGPIFGSGSAYLNRSNSAVLTRSDDAGLRLTGTSWTIRFGLKIVSQDQFGSERRILSKMDIPALVSGYRFLITRLGGSNHFLRILLVNSSGGTMDAGYTPITPGVFNLVTVTFDNATGTLKLYVDSSLQATITSAGFVLGGDAAPLRVGDPNVGVSAEVYIDELGIWTEAWTPARVMDDYQIVKCLI